jgi:hypothetical protein
MSMDGPPPLGRGPIGRDMCTAMQPSICLLNCCRSHTRRHTQLCRTILERDALLDLTGIVTSSSTAHCHVPVNRNVPLLHATVTYARLCLGSSLHSSSVSLLVEKLLKLLLFCFLGLLSAGR